MPLGNRDVTRSTGSAPCRIARARGHGVGVGVDEDHGHEVSKLEVALQQATRAAEQLLPLKAVRRRSCHRSLRPARRQRGQRRAILF